MPAPEFNVFLHGLRTESVRRMPPGARTFLSAGCAGGWYFRWIAENYPGIERHIGVEMYSPKPDDLPPNAEWIANSVADMRAVRTESVDLLFSGQNIEHLTEPDIVGFLCEASRVLRKGGFLVIDSPNRQITQQLGWVQPEHVVEFRVDEISELVRLAGFDIESIHGLWQCYDPREHRLLGLDPESDEGRNRSRVDAAQDDPENAFVWWLVARRSERECDVKAIEQRVSSIARDAFSKLSTRFKTLVGTMRFGPLIGEARGAKGVEGYLLYGPYHPLFPGRYHVGFRIRVLDKTPLPEGALGAIDVAALHRDGAIVAQTLTRDDLSRPDASGYCTLPLEFSLDEAAWGVEFRVFTTGRVALAVAVPVEVVTLDAKPSVQVQHPAERKASASWLKWLRGNPFGRSSRLP